MNNKNAHEMLLAKELRDMMNWQKIVILDNNSPSDVLKSALEKDGVTHICQTSNPFFTTELNTACVMMSQPVTFYNNPLSTILDPVHSTYGTERKFEIFEHKFQGAKQKAAVLDQVKKSTEQLKLSSSVLSDVVLIVDEFYTNAVFNAPFTDFENNKLGASRKNQETSMGQGKDARIFIGADHERIVIGCTDPFGKLNLTKLFERIKKCYDSGVASVINLTDKGGAGIGLFSVFNAACSFYSLVNKGRCTMVLCALPTKLKSRTRLELAKNLHFIVNEDRGDQNE